MTNANSSGGDSHPHEISDRDLDSMLKGHRSDDGAPEANRVADLMNALTGPPERTEFVGYQRAMTTYGGAFTRPRTRRIAMIFSTAGVRPLASAAGAAIALGAVATVVFASGAMGPAHQDRTLPVATSSTTSAAKDDNDKDDEDEKTDKTWTPVGPDASGPAAFGLCNAWTHHQGKDIPGNSVAFRNLAKAAGGEAKIAAYCAKIPHPGSSNATKTPKAPKAPKTSTPGHGKAPATPPAKTATSTTGAARSTGTSTPSRTTAAPMLTTPAPANTLPTATTP